MNNYLAIYWKHKVGWTFINFNHTSKRKHTLPAINIGVANTSRTSRDSSIIHRLYLPLPSIYWRNYSGCLLIYNSIFGSWITTLLINAKLMERSKRCPPLEICSPNNIILLVSHRYLVFDKLKLQLLNYMDIIHSATLWALWTHFNLALFCYL